MPLHKKAAQALHIRFLSNGKQMAKTMADMTKFSALVLCGGQGRRMGGEDKGLLLWRAKPMIQWISELLRPLTTELIISCNRHLNEYRHYADAIVTDEDTRYLGPLAGIRAGLAISTGDYLLVLPCDAPRMDTDLVMALFECAKTSKNRPVMVRQNSVWQPLFCVIPTQLAAAVEQAWADGQRSPRDLLLSLSAQALDCDADDIRLSNINTLEQLHEQH